MTLKAILTKEEHESLADHFKSEYVEKNGKFVLDVTQVDGWNLEDVRGLKSTMESERSRANELEKKLKKFGDLDPDSARDALKRLTDLGDDPTTDNKVREQIEALKKQLNDKHTKDKSSWDEEKTSLEREIERLLIDAEAGRILSSPDHKGSFELLIGPIKERSKVVKNDASGRFELRVLDQNGNARISEKQGSDSYMSLEEFVSNEMKNDTRYQAAFSGHGNSGSGATNAGTTSSQSSNKIDPSLPAVEKLKLARRQQAPQ